MEAEAKVSLDSSGYEQGVERVKKSDREAAATARESWGKVKDSAGEAFREVTSGAEKVRTASTQAMQAIVTGADRARASYRDLMEEARRMGRVLTDEQRRAGEGASRERGGVLRERDRVQPATAVDENTQYQARLRQMDFDERDQATKRRLEQRQERQRAVQEEAEQTRQRATRAREEADNLLRIQREATARGFRESALADALDRSEPLAQRENDAHGAMHPAMRRMMLMHSGRSIMDMTMAGQSPLRAVEMEGPRIAEAFGLGLGPTLGISAGVAVIAKMTSGYLEARDALRAFREEGAFVNGRGTGPQEYDQQIQQLAGARSTMREKTNGFWSTAGEVWKNILTRPIGSYNPFTDQTDEMEDRDQEAAAKGQQMVTLQKQKVAAMERENTIREDAARLGEHEARISQIDLETQKETQLARQRALAAPELSADDEVKQIERAGKLKKQQAQEDLENYRGQVALRRKISEIENPGVTTGAGFDRDAARQFSRVKSVAKLNADLSEALAELQRRKKAGENTDEASQRVLDSENALNNELHGQKERTRVLREQAEIQKLQLSGQNTAATNAGQLLTLESAITSARQAGDTAAANTLQSMKDQLTAAQNLQYFLHPELGRAEQAASQQHERDQRKSDLAGGFLNPRRDMSGNLLGGIDPRTGQYRDATEAERTAAKAAERRGPYTFHRATNSPENSPFSIPDNAEIPDVADIGSFGAEFGDAAGHVDATLRRNPGPRRIRPGDRDWEPVNKPWRTGGGLPRRLDARGGGDPRRAPSVLDSLGYHFPGEGLNDSHIPYRESFAEQSRPRVPQDPMQGVGSVVAALQAVTPELSTLVKSLQGIAQKIGTA